MPSQTFFAQAAYTPGVRQATLPLPSGVHDATVTIAVVSPITYAGTVQLRAALSDSPSTGTAFWDGSAGSSTFTFQQMTGTVTVTLTITGATSITLSAAGSYI